MIKIAAGDRARAETYVEQEMNSYAGYLDKFAERLEVIQYGMDSLKKNTAALQERIFGLQASTSGLKSDVDDARDGVADIFTAVSDNVGNLMNDIDEVRDKVAKTSIAVERITSGIYDKRSSPPRKRKRSVGPAKSLINAKRFPSSTPGRPLPISPRIPAGSSTQVGIPMPGNYLDPAGLPQAPIDVQNIWRHIGFSLELDAQALNILLDLFERRSTKKTGHVNSALANLEKVAGKGGCLVAALRKKGVDANEDPDEVYAPCESKETLCVRVSWIAGEYPGEYDEDATEKRWRVTKTEV